MLGVFAILHGNRSGRLEIPLNEKGQNPIYSTVTYSWVVTTILTDFVCMEHDLDTCVLLSKMETSWFLGAPLF